MVFVTNTNVRVDEELTIFYGRIGELEESSFESSSTRNRRLLFHYHFNCECVKCVGCPR